MFEAEEDGAITEMELAVILKTALGVGHLSVSRLFAAVDIKDTGKITFGKKPNPDIVDYFDLYFKRCLLINAEGTRGVFHKLCLVRYSLSCAFTQINHPRHFTFTL